MWLYCLYILLALLLPLFGTLLIICGSRVNTGYFSLHTLLSYPWTELQYEDPSFNRTALQLLQVRVTSAFI
jgi:hypothetical protein